MSKRPRPDEKEKKEAMVLENVPSLIADLPNDLLIKIVRLVLHDREELDTPALVSRTFYQDAFREAVVAEFEEQVWAAGLEKIREWGGNKPFFDAFYAIENSLMALTDRTNLSRVYLIRHAMHIRPTRQAIIPRNELLVLFNIEHLQPGFSSEEDENAANKTFKEMLLELKQRYPVLAQAWKDLRWFNEPILFSLSYRNLWRVLVQMWPGDGAPADPFYKPGDLTRHYVALVWFLTGVVDFPFLREIAGLTVYYIQFLKAPTSLPVHPMIMDKLNNASFQTLWSYLNEWRPPGPDFYRVTLDHKTVRMRYLRPALDHFYGYWSQEENPVDPQEALLALILHRSLGANDLLLQSAEHWPATDFMFVIPYVFQWPEAGQQIAISTWLEKYFWNGYYVSPKLADRETQSRILVMFLKDDPQTDSYKKAPSLATYADELLRAGKLETVGGGQLVAYCQQIANSGAPGTIYLSDCIDWDMMHESPSFWYGVTTDDLYELLRVLGVRSRTRDFGPKWPALPLTEFQQERLMDWIVDKCQGFPVEDHTSKNSSRLRKLLGYLPSAWVPLVLRRLKPRAPIGNNLNLLRVLIPYYILGRRYQARFSSDELRGLFFLTYADGGPAQLIFDPRHSGSGFEFCASLLNMLLQEVNPWFEEGHVQGDPPDPFDFPPVGMLQSVNATYGILQSLYDPLTREFLYPAEKRRTIPTSILTTFRFWRYRPIPSGYHESVETQWRLSFKALLIRLRLFAVNREDAVDPVDVKEEEDALAAAEAADQARREELERARRAHGPPDQHQQAPFLFLFDQKKQSAIIV